MKNVNICLSDQCSTYPANVFLLKRQMTPFARSVYSVESNWPEQGVGQVRSYVTCSWWFQNIRILFILLLRIFFCAPLREDLLGQTW